ARHLVPCLVLIVFIVWVMAIGWATATEAAAYGVLGALAIAWWSGGLSQQTFWESLMGATRLSCMIVFILAGASFLSSCMAFTGIPRALAEWVASLEPHKYTLIVVLAGIYILLGTALDGISMIVLTTSIVIPMVEKAGFDLVLFGIFIVLLVEIAELTPPPTPRPALLRTRARTSWSSPGPATTAATRKSAPSACASGFSASPWPRWRILQRCRATNAGR